MERIKKIDDIIIGEGEVLVDLINKERKSGIVVKEKLTDKQTNHYGVIVAKGSAVKDLDIGDIVVRTRVDSAPSYKYKERELLLFSRYNIAIAVKAVNFDTTDQLTA